ncbi:MAG: hypothetical protein U1F06_01045 [Steroidobacteraceae bacterium]
MRRARLLAAGAERLGLSGRALHRVLRVARTIADLEGARRSRQGTWPRRCSCGGHSRHGGTVAARHHRAPRGPGGHARAAAPSLRRVTHVALCA